MSPFSGVSSETTKDSWWKDVKKSDFQLSGQIEKQIKKQRWKNQRRDGREEKNKEDQRRERLRRKKTQACEKVEKTWALSSRLSTTQLHYTRLTRPYQYYTTLHYTTLQYLHHISHH